MPGRVSGDAEHEERIIQQAEQLRDLFTDPRYRVLQDILVYAKTNAQKAMVRANIKTPEGEQEYYAARAKCLLIDELQHDFRSIVKTRNNIIQQRIEEGQNQGVLDG